MNKNTIYRIYAISESRELSHVAIQGQYFFYSFSYFMIFGMLQWYIAMTV